MSVASSARVIDCGFFRVVLLNHFAYGTLSLVSFPQVKLAGTAGIRVDEMKQNKAVVSLKNKKKVRVALIPSTHPSFNTNTDQPPFAGPESYWWYPCLW